MRRATPLVMLLALLPLLSPLAAPPARSAAQDNDVWWAEVLHDSRDPYYRSPGWGTSQPYRSGAVPAGTEVTLRLRTAAHDLTSATLRVWHGSEERETLVPMSVESSSGGYEYWVGRLRLDEVTDAYYAFILRDGWDEDWYLDGPEEDGGMGRMHDDHSLFWRDYSIVFHDPAFRAPAWHKDAVAYQVFPDSFRNGDPSNDPRGDGARGDVTWWEWDRSGLARAAPGPGDAPRVHARKLAWGEPRPDPQDGGARYGGDFAGIAQEARYLAGLGVTELYVNPWMPSPDYHGYAVDDYRAASPYLGKVARRVAVAPGSDLVVNDEAGSLAAFDAMTRALDAQDIRLVGDMVFNHAGAQSRYFQRFEHTSPDWGVPDPWPGLDGAYEAQASPHADWFWFDAWNHRYEGWWGFQNLPVLRYDRNASVLQELVTGPDSALRFWAEHGVGGFRLDVSNEYHDGQGSRLVNCAIRDAAKAQDSEAAILGEVWGEASRWLAGDMNDGVMDYRWRAAVLGWLRGEVATRALDEALRGLEEDYPWEATAANWRLLGTHDTPRVRTALGDAQLHGLATLLQFVYPGVPLVYYGDELGMEGGGDPANRAAMAWDSPDESALLLYRLLGQLRRELAVLRAGNITHLHAQGDVLAFARELPGASPPVALVVVNRGAQAQRVLLDASPAPTLEPLTLLADALSLTAAVVSPARGIAVEVPARGALLLVPAS